MNACILTILTTLFCSMYSCMLVKQDYLQQQQHLFGKEAALSFLGDYHYQRKQYT